MNFRKLDIEKYERFESIDGVPLNSPPWGTITSFDIIKKRVNWQIAHGNYEQLKIPHKGLGSEIFGCPIIASFENKVYLIINASGGAKYEKFPQGDAVIAYQLK